MKPAILAIFWMLTGGAVATAASLFAEPSRELSCTDGFRATGVVLEDVLQREMAMQAELKEIDDRDRKVMALFLLKQP
jgi:hypothetical protein